MRQIISGFDECFEHTAQAIAGGILMTLQSPEGQQEYYQIQVGAYAEKDLARDCSASCRPPAIRHFLFTRMAFIRYG